MRWKIESSSWWLISRVNRIWVVAAAQPSPVSLRVQHWPGELWSVPFQDKCDRSVTGKLGKVRRDNLKLCLPLATWSLCAVNAVSCWCRSLGDITVSFSTWPSLMVRTGWWWQESGQRACPVTLVGSPFFQFCCHEFYDKCGASQPHWLLEGINVLSPLQRLLFTLSALEETSCFFPSLQLSGDGSSPLHSSQHF